MRSGPQDHFRPPVASHPKRQYAYGRRKQRQRRHVPQRADHSPKFRPFIARGFHLSPRPVLAIGQRGECSADPAGGHRSGGGYGVHKVILEQPLTLRCQLSQ